jgi:hypothetical protein
MSTLFFMVIVRLAALYFIMNGLNFFSVALYSVFSEQYDGFQRVSALVLGLNLLISTVLFCFPRVVLLGLNIRTDPGREVPRISDFQSAGIALIGLYFVLESLANLVFVVVTVEQMRNLGMGIENLPAQNKADFVSYVFQFVLGLLAVIGSNGLSRMITRLRTIGTRPSGETAGE